MTNKEHSPIILYGARILSPYIMVFGFYVIFHGHYSPGGGFQGGTLLGRIASAYPHSQQAQKLPTCSLKTIWPLPMPRWACSSILAPG
ncbi:MAG: MnhB domain-containing protein [Balneolaceae bacterium]|nr:MnhB domain-containing protein [Balneolaceae bacterium]